MPMKKLLFVTALALVAAPALAQHAGHGTAKPAATAAGELADGEIKNIGMGAMTMSFKLKDPKMADQLKEGDKVKFAVEQKGEDLIITSIAKAP
jgi:Cu/Ag efflux protein CusF